MTEKSPTDRSSIKPATKLTILLAVIIALALGAAAGLGTYTFVYAKGASYLTDDPQACANCHNHAGSPQRLDQIEPSRGCDVQRLSYASRIDPEILHQSGARILSFAGLHHGQFHEPIQIKERSRRVTENACRKCHQDTVHDIEATTTSDTAMSCIRCHAKRWTHEVIVMSNLTLKDRLLNFYRTKPLAVFAVLVVIAAIGAVIGTIVLVSIIERKQEARNPFFRVVELTEDTVGPRRSGEEFSPAIRRLSPHGGPAAHALWR
jgi:cytochrome c nitrite reductase small subunit